MTPADELRADVLHRLNQLGRGHAHRVSVIARTGEPRPDAAVWKTLDDLWVDGAVDHLGGDRYRLPMLAQEQLQWEAG